MRRRFIIVVSFGLAAACAQAADTASGIAAAPDGGWNDDWTEDWSDEPDSGRLPLSGFLEGALGSRWDKDEAVGRYATLAEARGRLQTGWENDAVKFVYKGDFLVDAIDKDFALDIRDLSLSFSPANSLDIKVGRQVLTWGTGDLVFLNDLFPKDWVSFFAGREDEYLKAPSNTLRITQYNGFINIDFAWTAEFKPDEYIRGERFSYFSPFAGDIIGNSPPLLAEKPGSGFSNGEFALRLFKSHNSIEYALYGYSGFFKTPSAIVAPFELAFAPMTSFGGSIRRPLGPGLFNVEASYYISRDDRSGTNPQIVNSQLRFLAGYEWEAARNFNVGLQYYLENIRDYDRLTANSPFPEYEPPENRHTLTARLTYRAMQDKLTASFFAFWSPNENDAYLRPAVSYRANDQWIMTFGLNLHLNRKPQTFLGQFENNSNLYLRLRYNY